MNDNIIQFPRDPVRSATDEELKAVWDAWDGGGWDTAIDPEDAYFELNRRGLGDLCAI